MIHKEGYSFRELRGDDGMGWVGRDGIDVAATGARELSREDNLAVAAAVCNGLNSEAESTWMLDQAWHRINSLGGTYLPGDFVAKAYVDAIGAALAIIEERGGMDPLQRNLDPRTPEFGVAP
jgi:hypothetical protein